ncbi:MAG: alpha/beta fold hydrolase [Ruminococcaceae bacterium]|nr:alpha/beta fold hydrolase [Oscillospiraceae bacterium]
MKTKFVEANGMRFNVFDEGSGEPILLLHGFPDSMQVWRDVIPPLLDAGYRVIAPDQRGFGETTAPENVSDYDMPNLIADIIHLLAALGVKEKVKLVGHDWGAGLGWAAVISKPEYFSSYVAMSTGHTISYNKEGGFEQEVKKWYILCFLMENHFAEQLFSQNDWAALRLFTQNHPEMDINWKPDMERPGRFTAAINWYRANITRAMKAAPGPLPPNVTVPVLGIYSDGDWYLSEKQMTESHKYVDNWTYQVIQGCGHWIPLDKPLEAADIILNYYKTL